MKATRLLPISSHFLSRDPLARGRAEETGLPALSPPLKGAACGCPSSLVSALRGFPTPYLVLEDEEVRSGQNPAWIELCELRNSGLIAVAVAIEEQRAGFLIVNQSVIGIAGARADHKGSWRESTTWSDVDMDVAVEMHSIIAILVHIRDGDHVAKGRLVVEPEPIVARPARVDV
jgi:hypothetical protein